MVSKLKMCEFSIKNSGFLPNVIVVGPMKAGTSWIHDYLEYRGDVVLPNGVKETMFFDKRFEKGLDWYMDHFKHLKNNSSIVVEVAPSYFHCDEAPVRIKKTLGDCKVIITVRDPVKRAWSHYLHLRRKGYTKSNIRDAINEYPEIIKASCYKTLISKWYDVFSLENVYFLEQDLLASDPDEFASTLCRALNMPFTSVPDELREKRNAAAVPRSFYLALLTRKVANLVRDFRGYRIINYAKKIGLKDVVFGAPDNGIGLPMLNDEDLEWLQIKLKGEKVEIMSDGHVGGSSG